MINGIESRFSDFFKRAVVPSQHMRRIFTPNITVNVFVGLGRKTYTVTYILCGRAARNVIDIEFTDTATSELTRNLCLEILKYYENMRGKTGLQQQVAILSNLDKNEEGVWKRFMFKKLDQVKEGTVAVKNSEG